MDLRQYLQAIRKFWWVILIPGILGGLFGVFTVSRVEPEYRASMTFFVRTTGTSAGQLDQGDQFAQRRVNSYVALLSSDRLAQKVIDSTGLDLTTKQVSGLLGATGDINTVLLTATVTSGSEELATTVADAVAADFIELVNEVENPAPAAVDEEQVGPSVSLERVSGPTVSQVPTQPIMTVGLRVMLGLALGFGLALLLELRDTSVRTEDQLDALGVGPLLGRIPFDRKVKDAPLVFQDDTHSIRAEAFRQLRTNLQFIDIERPIQILVVTSSVAEEGKSAMSANLALAVSASGRRVLVIEADFRRPKLADYFGVERAVGITDVLAGRVDIEDVLQPWGDDGLVILPSGQIPPNPSELLGSAAMARLLERFRSEYDLIIVDTPPLLPVTDAAVAATRADGAVIAVRYGRTTRHQVTTSVRSLEAVGAKVLGSVLSMVPTNKGSGYTTYRYDPLPEARGGSTRPTNNKTAAAIKGWRGAASTKESTPPVASDSMWGRWTNHG